MAAAFAVDDRREGPDQHGHLYPVFLNLRNPAEYGTTEELLRHAARQKIPISHLPDAVNGQPRGFQALYEEDPEFRTGVNVQVWQTQMQKGCSSFARRLGQRFRQRLKEAGYDGLIYPMPIGPTCYIAFEPEQIKSAIANDGTFDADDPSILS